VGGEEWGSTAWPVSMVSNTEGGRGGGEEWGVHCLACFYGDYGVEES
jgi:hypothetical protein